MGRSFIEDQSERDETHRGGFGDFAGEERGLIDRSFRERIVLAGVSLEGTDKEITELSPVSYTHLTLPTICSV